MLARSFLLVTALLVSSLVSCSNNSPRPDAATRPAQSSTATDGPLEVIDAHTHTAFMGTTDRESGITYSKEHYFREWREAGIVGAVSHAGNEGEKEEDLRSMGVMHCYGLPGKVDVKALEAGLKSGRYGCIKVYLGYVYQYANDPNYRPAYKLAQKYDVPVVFHTGDTDTHLGKLKYSDPLTIDEVAVDFQKVRFVIAHCGNPWHASAAEVAYKNPNVWLECSAFLIGKLSDMDPDDVNRHMVEPIKHIFGYIENPKKLMFGSDWPLVGIKEYLEIYKRAIPREHWRAVFHDNAVQVFKLGPRPKAQ